MADIAIRLGATVDDTDGECGHVTDVLVGTVSHLVASHLIVEPTHRSGLGRLVPLDLVASVADGRIALHCDRAAFDQLGSGEETDLEPGSNGGYGGYALGEPVPSALAGRSSFGVVGGSAIDAFDPVVKVTPPPGEAALQATTAVHATDGEIGQVEGVVVDAASGRVNALLLRAGHVWHHMDVVVPLAAIAGIDDGVRLTISRSAARDLPAVDLP